MALFNSAKDAAFINKVNYELIGDIIEQNVHIYKLDVNTTDDNLYGESSTGKSYGSCIRIPCIVTKEDEEWGDSEFGVDVNQTATFAFLKDMLIDRANVVIEVGDIIDHDNAYWEVDSTVENQYWGGKRPADPNLSDGASISIVASAHMTRRSKLSIENIQGPRSSKVL
tara:strand:+ start:313 stop:819 length:507 start_codon:yes stop_codon:yes gene_type:complete